MRKKIVLFAVVLTMVVSFAGIAVGAGNVLIDTLGAAFLSEDNSYVPLRSVGGFLGAQLKWDAAKGQAVLTYNGQDLALTPSNTNAVFQGQPVVLSSPPVVVRGVTYIPASALKQFYNVPVEWDAARSEVKIKGPTGWGTMKVQSRPPWHGGPPPWAPAWGERRKQGVHNPQAPGNNQQQNKGEGQQKGQAKGK